MYNEEMALAVFQTNSISAADDGAGIFPQTARLNHGCSKAFNSVYNWRSSEAALVVHALKDIKKGEVSLGLLERCLLCQEMNRYYRNC